jgi:hypothetical protein
MNGVDALTKDRRKRRRGSVSVVAVGVTLVAALMTGACGGDDEPAGDDELPSTTAQEQATTTREPPATEPAAVEPIVVDLLTRLDAVTTEIVGDPGVAVNDPESPALAELAEIFAPGDAFNARLDTYRRNAEVGITSKPVNADQVVTTTVVGDLRTVDENSIEGSLCVLNTYRSTGPTGGEVKDHVANPGLVTAVRIDGSWKIQQIDMDDAQLCEWEEGSA